MRTPSNADLLAAMHAAVHFGRAAYASSVSAELSQTLSLHADEHGVTVTQRSPDLPMREVPAYDAPGPRVIFELPMRAFENARPELTEDVDVSDPEHRCAMGERFMAKSGAVFMRARFPEQVSMRATRAEVTVSQTVKVTRKWWFDSSREQPLAERRPDRLRVVA